MIVTLTPNPSLDRTFVLSGFRQGALNRSHSESVDPGGKGVNVSVALASNGHTTLAIVPAGGPDGVHLLNALQESGVTVAIVPTKAGVRSNITLVEESGLTTKINSPGPTRSEAELDALAEATVAKSQKAAWVVACGSLPPITEDDFYANLVGRVRAPIAVDTTGDALMRAVRAGADLIKPNLLELAEVADRSPTNLGEVITIAQELRREGAGRVLVSLGRHGAILVGESVLHGSGYVRQVRSSVGAGDALLAGFLAEQSTDRASLARAIAWASASCETSNTKMPSPEAVRRQRVTIHDSVNSSLTIRD